MTTENATDHLPTSSTTPTIPSAEPAGKDIKTAGRPSGLLGLARHIPGVNLAYTIALEWQQAMSPRSYEHKLGGQPSLGPGAALP
ncbi:MAG: hypothetical protein AAGA91_12670 [Pseudomonadota bacterium]